MTGEQLRAARALLRMDRPTLAEKSGVSVNTIESLEKTVGDLQGKGVFTTKALKAALETAGVIFVGESGDGPGVMLREIGKEPMVAVEGEAAIIKNNDM